MVELMMATGIIGLIAMMSAPLLIHTQRFFLMNKARVEIQRDARSCMANITRRIRQARSSTVVISQMPGQPNYSRIAFTDISNRPVMYYQSGSTLYEVSGSTKTLSQNIRFMTFFFPRTDDMTIVSVSMTFEKRSFEGKTKALHVASERVRIMD